MKEDSFMEMKSMQEEKEVHVIFLKHGMIIKDQMLEQEGLGRKDLNAVNNGGKSESNSTGRG